MAKENWMIYGANGYTGQLLAEEAVRRGHRPVLAGRSADKLKPVAERLGLDFVAVDLHDGPQLAQALSRVELVFHAAGPFIDTSDQMVRACLASSTHYIDVTGEVPVFQNTFRYGAEAQQRGVLLLSGAGFDVVPTDCLAGYLAHRLPGATELEIAISGVGGPSPGTLKSMVDGGLNGGLVRRNGQLVSLPVGKGAKTVRFHDRERKVMPIPWGDLETAHRTTGIPNITTYMALSKQMIALSSASWPLTAAAAPLLRAVLGRPAIKRSLHKVLDKSVKGPDEQMRRTGRSQVWACVRDRQGKSVQAWLETGESYAFTAQSGVRVVERALSARRVGALTPAQAFGHDFVLEIEGTRRYDA